MRTTILFILVLLFIVITNMPSQFTIGGRKFYRPMINISLGNGRIIRDLNFRLGLDLQGGTHLAYAAGVSEALVQTSRVGDENRLIVELPGVKDVNQAISTIGTTALLEFRQLAPDKSATEAAFTDFLPTGLTGAELKLAQVQFGNSQGQISSAPSVGLEFNSEGAGKFSELTKNNIGKPLAIFLDEVPVTAPTVQTEITDGKAVITGDFTVDEAKRLVVQLNAGALPVPIKIIEQRNIGATLGSESVAKSLFAGLVGLVLIWVFMLANYGFKGLLANIALTIYVLISLSLFRLIPVTLTLAGIAGFILSVGMAVDANILIF